MGACVVCVPACLPTFVIISLDTSCAPIVESHVSACHLTSPTHLQIISDVLGVSQFLLLALVFAGEKVRCRVRSILPTPLLSTTRFAPFPSISIRAATHAMWGGACCRCVCCRAHFGGLGRSVHHCAVRTLLVCLRECSCGVA